MDNTLLICYSVTDTASVSTMLKAAAVSVGLNSDSKCISGATQSNNGADARHSRRLEKDDFDAKRKAGWG